MPIFGDRVDIRTQLTIEEAGPWETRQVIESEVRIDMLGIGKIAEHMVKSSVRETYEKLPEIVARWVGFRVLGLWPGG